MAPEKRKDAITVYGYRWVVVVVYVFLMFMMQVFWICYAPINKAAGAALGVSDNAIGLLALVFMYVFIPLALPASWAIDTWGFKRAVSLGAVLMGIFGLLRGFFVEDYTLTLIMTIGIALAQPLFLNSSTKMAANWFRLEERATIIGVGGMFTLLGIVAGQIATPILLEFSGLRSTMMLYGVLGVVAAVLFLIFAKDHPPTPAGHEEKALMLDGLKRILNMRDFYLLAFIFFVINAIFNGIATWVEVMVRPCGLGIDEAGLIGGLLILGGMLGFVVFSAISDRMRKRKPALIAAALLSVPFLVLMAYVSGFAGLAIVSFLLGLSVMGGMPVVFQYVTEISYPAPEGTSQGMLNIGGQISALAIGAMEWSNRVHGSFAPSLLVFAAAMLVGAVLVGIMKELKLILAAK